MFYIFFIFSQITSIPTKTNGNVAVGINSPAQSTSSNVSVANSDISSGRLVLLTKYYFVCLRCTFHFKIYCSIAIYTCNVLSILLLSIYFLFIFDVLPLNANANHFVVCEWFLLIEYALWICCVLSRTVC